MRHDSIPVRRPILRCVAIAALPLALPVVCATCGVSTQQEVQMGLQESQQINAQMPLVTDPEINRYVNLLGDSIARLTSRGDLDWHFYVVNTDVVNAFALPGGYIYVNRGVIERADKMDELAGVLGHEIGHVVLRHSVKQMEQMQGANVGLALACTLTQICQSQATQAAINVGGNLVFAKFSRDDERQADEQGFQNVTRAGISPEGMLTFFQKLLAEEQAQGGSQSGAGAWFADHPGTQDRIADIQRMINTLSSDRLATLTVNTQGFQALKQRVAALPPAPKQQPGQE
jgi:predicted Zn-dependent protease